MAGPLRTFLFRVDGGEGSRMGMGHVYRSLALAGALRERHSNAPLRFLMRPFPDGMAKVSAAGFEVLPLPFQDRTEENDDAVREAVVSLRPALLVMDTLGTQRPLMARLRPLVPCLWSIDDIEPGGQEADGLLNGIVWLWRWLPEEWGRARVFQGIAYNVLRPQFAAAHDAPRAIPERARRLLVTVGGADETRATERLVERLRPLAAEMEMTVVLGPAHPDPEGIARLAGATVRVLRDVQDMAALMLEADLALTTGGTSLFELAACGTPALVLCIAEHQAIAGQWFAEQGAAEFLGLLEGSYRRDLESVTGAAMAEHRTSIAVAEGDRIVEVIARLARDRAARARMSAQGRALVDGRGLERAVAAIEESLARPSTHVTMRSGPA
ncbi:MAG: hypothetical protein HY688_04685 [Chloroflexi bacterium]|nr:hypothetical protein [Chloroflexota bacterium]